MAGAASVPGSDELVLYKSVDPITGADVGTDQRRGAGVVRPDPHAGLLEPTRADGGGAAR